MSRTLAVGDIHGNYKGFKQVLERASFDYENDTLIQLGDVVDGHSQTFEVVEELLKIKNLIALKGNHDEWFNIFIKYSIHTDNWKKGGYHTARSYLKQIDKEDLIVAGYQGYNTALLPEDIPESHRDFFNKQELYYIDNENRLFVHAGFDRTKTIKETQREDISMFYWDRELWKQAMSCTGSQKLGTHDNFSHIFIGHTTTSLHSTTLPITRGGVTNLDTDGGWLGKITIMDVNTMIFWQSDLSRELYPDFKSH